MASTAALGAFGAGSLAFWTFFHRGEHFEYGVRYIQLTLVSVFAGTIFLSSSTNITPTKALAASSRFAGIFLAGVYINCIAYRLFLNPLNSIPGPFLARLSKLNHAFQNKGFTAHHTLLEMHERYGKFVRVGPNDVSVSDVDGIEVISSAKSKCTKSPWYGQDGQSSLQQTRDRAFHDRRRRVWAPAFSDKAIRGYETRVQTYNDLLISKLAESEGQPINATNILNLYSFDTMGDLAFGKDFGMLEKGDVHWAIKILTDGLDVLGLQLPHWILPLALAIPGALKEILQLVDFCTAQLRNRIAVHDKTDPERRDITHTLIDHYQESDDQNSSGLYSAEIHV
ncbi:hypothetical protein OHC33_001005 [Knufia fluminis]|uniref:Cytochrome P450 n=1 Tax=Knufia fluminis TaxID=191047 RepID=A0AAN8IC06_9EURO|nr:hypothetical protein OHC33_001005 [Knufia fluminis]